MKITLSSKRRLTLLAIVEYHAKALLKGKTVIIGHGLVPFSYILLITLATRGELLPAAIIGGMIAFAIGGLADIPIELSGMRVRSKFYDIFLSLPISPLTFASGLSIGLSLVSLPYLSVLLTLTLFLAGGLNGLRLTTLALVILSVWVWASLTGLYLGLKVKEPALAVRLSAITMTVLTVLPPVYYPLEILPSTLHIPVLLIPTVSAAYLLRSIYGPLPHQDVAFLVLVSYLIFSLALGTKAMRLKEE